MSDNESGKLISKREQRHHSLFSELPLGVIEQDWSMIKKKIDKLNAEEIENLPLYFKNNPLFLRSLVDSIKINCVNDSILKIYGANSEAEFLKAEENAEGWWDEEWENLYASEISALASTNKINYQELKESRMDGSIFDVRLITRLVSGDEDTWQRILTIVEDVTERKTYEAELIKAHQKLKDKQRQLVHSEKLASVGLLAAGVAHEINNPNGFVKSNLEALADYKNSINAVFQVYSELEQALMLHQEILNESEIGELLNNVLEIKQQQHLDYILSDIPKLLDDSINGTVRIQKIVMDLKQFSRVDDTGLKWVDLNEEVIETALRIVWSELKYKCKLNKSLAPLPKYKCRPGELGQVIMNLLLNAGHAIGVKGEVSLTSEITDMAINISVADTGLGITEDDILKIFDPFYTSKEIGKGIGLGLSISQSIVEKHGGTISVDSDVNKGTVFTVSLPLD
ncbi:ATP-binding protein [Thalassotalea psychrophila]|uniref:histidine kinase n=1 Tax=Thalassotalea psychrophila TaxID=3065647 RepID=A0ABY9TY70_9GAMM|nr:ATP-binding protein [Colwelliaceae bacterium SQ149]